MKPWFACTAALIGFGAVCDAPAADKETRGSWLESVTPARAEARRSGRPLFVVFR